MRKLLHFGILLIFLSVTNFILAQDIPAKPSMTKAGKFIGISKPLRDLPTISKDEFKRSEKNSIKELRHEEWDAPTYPFASSAEPKGPDQVWQRAMNGKTGNKAPMANFVGQDSPYFPPDVNGAAGPNHYMQTVNTTYAIYSKTGTLLAGPTNLNLLFGSVTGANYNDGDPIILYDEQADRYVVAEFSVSGTNDYMLIAVSTTNDPTGTWYQYSFDVADMPDYEKLAVWQDGYYMGTNTSSGNDIYVFERSKMLMGQTAQMVAFDNPNRPATTSVMVVPPVDNDGAFAPAGTPGTFIAFNDDAVGGGSDQLWIYELAVNWTTPASSTFSRTQQINVAAFDSNLGSGWENIAQPGTTRKLCAISYVIMNVPQYRNFGTYQSIVCCHSVDVDGTDHAGVRWYELRKTGATWAVRQQGTYAPDAHSRWMGSISMNGSNKIAIGYSVSSSTEYPGIRYAGQSSAAFAAANGVMDVPEEIIHTGTNYQTTYNRWGDYSSICVDPTDDQTFWFTTEYIGASEARKTKIASFKIGNTPVVATLAASAVTSTSATLNGTVNPNGLATTYYFEYGTSISYGTLTSTVSAGSGSTAVGVSASVSGLTLNGTYHFRLVGVNADGTTYGSDKVFIAGGAILTTTAASAIGLTNATSGGTITSDGGSAITARGVCWAITANPTVSGSHTTDGSGLGSFSSSITGLSASTPYHVRAYATNSNGTYYGDDLLFTTLCGVYTPPFSQSFSGTTIPGCWTQVDHQGNSQIWQFGTITTQSPNPALTGNYAFLNSDAYGSGNTQNADLISPTIDLSGYTNVALAFNHYFKSYSGSSGTVSYSLDNGTTWTAISAISATSATNPAAFSQTIAALAGQSLVKFKWNYTGTWGYSWAIDDVSVTGTFTTPTLSVSPGSQSVTPLAGSTSFTVTSNSAWTVSSNQAWCVPVSGGSGNGTLTVNYTQNTTSTARTANITVSVIGLAPIVVTVVQAGPTIGVSPTSTTVEPVSGSTNYSVTSNSIWTAVSTQGWCTVTSGGTGNGTLTATYTQNTGSTSRTAKIAVAVSGLTADTVTLVQSAPTLSVGPANQAVTSDAGTASYSVVSNSGWTATSDQAWCSVTSSGTGNGSLTATYSANTALTSRVATITVSVTGLTPVTVTLTQSGFVPTLTVTPVNQNVLSPSGSTNFQVVSNSSWIASSNQPWCTVTPSGTGNGTMVATYSENTATTSRMANLTVLVTGASPFVVTVTQAGATPPEFLYTIANDVQTSATTFEFDLLLLDNDPTLPFEVATVQAGILMNPAVYNGGTVTASIVPSSSTMYASQQPTSVTFTQSANVVKLAAKAPPGAGNGTVLSTNPAAPNRLCRIKLTNSVAWAQAQPNLTFCFTTVPYPTKISQYISGLNTAMSTNLSNCYSVCANGLLNPPPSLNVTPSDQTVTAVAGTTTFTVTCNAAWTVSSDQPWCTVGTGTFGNGTITATYTANTTSSQRIANITVSVIGLPSHVVTVSQNGLVNKTLNLTAFLEGLYSGSGQMNPAMDESGIHWGASIADKITVELHDGSNYSSLIYSSSNVDLHTDGTASITLPSSYSGNYYITIRHRNSIETVSAAPVSFAGSTVAYSFDNSTKAFGGNMLQKPDGTWVIYGGDANQDGLVDSSDMLMVDNDASNFVTGYIVSDINGDGLVDSGDMIILDNNASNFIAVVLP